MVPSIVRLKRVEQWNNLIQMTGTFDFAEWNNGEIRVGQWRKTHGAMEETHLIDDQSESDGGRRELGKEEQGTAAWKSQTSADSDLAGLRGKSYSPVYVSPTSR